MTVPFRASSAHIIPVIDLFAGPGGLGEGFSSCRPLEGAKYRIGLSVEMEECAHQTLQLRAFRRQFDQPPKAYWELLRGEIERQELFERFPAEAEAAGREARRITLSARTAGKVRELVTTALAGRDKWVLIGGPPCQAYSQVGRSRNRGTATYDADRDRRHVLYLEYLQLLAEHAPPVFVMENVKGLLTAKYRRDRMFDRIHEDLQSPAAVIGKKRRSARPRADARYRLIPLSPAPGLFPGEDPADFLVRSEEFGIPQTRHRVIIIGVRSDFRVPDLRLRPLPSTSVRAAISDLPALRSGITDHEGEWAALIGQVPGRRWMKHIPADLQRAIRVAVQDSQSRDLNRGGEFLRGRNSACPPLRGWCNHSTRAHILADLERYLFASCFAALSGRSPDLSDFPEGLLPSHANVARALATGHFADRFRVQVADRPGTTVTSHISKDGHYYIHYDPSQCRSLTVREAARLQTFPDDYLFCGPRTAQYQQVGNAVPPSLARQIAELILPVLV
jgi:DNA (cytosine-5)-methyltransferase 1